jgi:saposin
MLKLFLFFVIIGSAVGIPIFFPIITRPIISNQKKMEIPKDNCGICNYIVANSEEHITNETLEKTAVHTMENTCMNLPRKRHDQCINMIHNNFKRMISMISKKEDSSIICSEMHICHTTQKNITDCNFCKYASVRIEGFLNRNHTLFDLINFAETFCEDVSENYYESCTNLMNIHYFEIIERLMDRTNPIDVCEAIKLCSGGSALPP